MMKNKKGFTLMEILLAALIVGVIGIALAALTTAAVREGGVGRTKVMLRQQLSLALRQLRQDIEQSSSVILSAEGDSLTLNQEHSLGPNHAAKGVVYRFELDPHNNPQPGVGGGYIGGTITRTVNGGTPEVWLTNVKQISKDGFTSPSFMSYSGRSSIRVRIIVEVPTEPVVNDVIDEVFMLPQGYNVTESSY